MNTHAEIMNVPNPAASVRYSGQCCRNAVSMPSSFNHVSDVRSQCRISERAIFELSRCQAFPNCQGQVINRLCCCHNHICTLRNLASCRKTRIQGHPAIHKNACAIDVIGLIGSQEHGNSPDVVWLADAFVGNQRHERFIRL